MTHQPNIAKAVALLDQRRPGWYKEIDLEQLYMADTTDCILAQLYGNYLKGKNVLNVPQDLTNAFCCFDDEWKQLILERRKKDAERQLEKPLQHITAFSACPKAFEQHLRQQGTRTMPNSTDIFRRNAESALGISQQAIPAGFDDIIHRLGKSIATNRTDCDVNHIMSMCKTFKNMSDKGFKIAAIKLVRTFTDCGLSEAKEFVEYCQEML